MKEPWFWRDRGTTARALRAALAPAAALYQAGADLRTRIARPYRAPATIICIGNASVGGVGKTPFGLMLHELVHDLAPTHFLTRGYGGALKGPVAVDPDRHSAREVGDEALLLARHGPTWVSRRRAAGAAAAARAGAALIIMDDGYQNPTIRKDLNILLLSDADAAPDLALFPAGPLREPVAKARARADAVVHVAPAAGIALHADFIASTEPSGAAAPARVVAFCGIGHPERFFGMLRRDGFDLADAVAFPDHHLYTAHDLAALRKRAAALNAALITTEKDIVRLAPATREDIRTLPIRMTVSDPARLRALVTEALARAARP